ncbi:hypothetical protein HanHA300_Chr10g0380461 [Helianthus annuus]|nr:hypothetical protein HanHA300_Chr10g0380461 [Helianthus annuus]
MPTSTYPKEWKNWFIFVSTSMIPESPPLRDPKATIKDSVDVLFANETVMWKRMYEHPTRAYSFPEGILAMGGLSPLYSFRPKAYFGKNVIFFFASLQCLLIVPRFVADCKEISFVDCGVVNLEMGNVLEGILLMSGVLLLLGRWRRLPPMKKIPRRRLMALRIPPPPG